MPDGLDKIPEKTRWEIATKGLTGAYIAISNALKQAVGQKKIRRVQWAALVWSGKGSERLCRGPSD